ncbi:MAG: hypothetical protein WHX60_08520 [Armatimonadota bacterium]
MTTQAGWYDEYGRQLVEASPASARACFYLGSAVGLITDLAALPNTALQSTILKPQWNVRAVLTLPFPSSIRLYGEGWQFEVLSDPSQSASLSGKVDGQDFTISLSALSAPQPQLLSWQIIDTALFRNSPAQRLLIQVNGDYPAGGIELPRALRDADYYSVDDRLAMWLWYVEGNKLRAYSRSTGQEASGSISDTFVLFIAGHLY